MESQSQSASEILSELSAVQEQEEEESASQGTVGSKNPSSG